ncbi:acyl-CoA dehydrogenase family protein [bacterium]|nr:acyl-CoA dehydrogenase family protein [bacterium]
MSEFDLTEQNMYYRDQGRKIARECIRPLAAELDRTGEYPHKLFETLHKENLAGIWVPTEYGGRGASLLDLVIFIEEMARECGGMAAIYAVNALGSFPLILVGTQAQKDKYLPRIARGELKTAFGLSEPQAGSDAGNLTTTARVEADRIVLNGTKKWNTNGGIAGIYTIFANAHPEKGARGITAYLVEKDTPGFRVGKREQLMGIRCVPVHELHLEDCRIEPSQQLGAEGEGFKIAMQTLDMARPGIGAQAVGIAQGALDLALSYTQDRQQFGQPIARNQAIQFKIADMGTQIHAARLLVRHAARAIVQQSAQSQLYASMAKLFASDTAMSVTTDAVQLFGGYGYCQDFPIEKYLRDAKITQIYEGTNEIQRMVIARALFKAASNKDKQ